MDDDYIRNLSLKYRLAVAIAVLQEKPQDVPIETYIEDLKTKINNENIKEIDLTVCSDDFDIEESQIVNKNTDIIDKSTNDNSVTILKDYIVISSKNDMDLREDNINLRQQINEKNNMVESEITNEEIHINLRESQNFSQKHIKLDTQSTFCETQHIENTSNEVQNEIDIVINEVDINRSTVNLSDHTYYDSQATEIYSLHGFTENVTHISQSQNYEQIVINDKYLKAKNNIQLNNCIIDVGISNNSTEKDKDTNKNNLITTEYIRNEVVINEINNSTTREKHNTTDANINETNTYSMDINEFPQYAQDLNEIEITENIETDTDNTKTNENCNKNNEININNDDDDTKNESEIVSFKVLEELNKIKNYINKKMDRRISIDGSTDSGYKSDSQSKSSFRSSLQLSGNWLNQSAHSLYEYISTCPLLGSTHEIIGEIAQVLGQLIDRLHEEEKYPSFLDELLENVNFLIQDIYQENGDEDVLLRKDDKIQRLLFLNKSVHIQKYTIEKITNLLETTLTHITNNEDAYEISNIIEMENICYIFHILEVILQRYIKAKNIPSQELTDSQIELKKSSITELWRKKWNPNYKDANLFEEFVPNKCVLIKCNEVLNKVIIGCMDGYSLIAFAALNCFNLLQS